MMKETLFTRHRSAVACGGTGSSVNRSENWSRPIPSIGLGRHTTTTTPCIETERKFCGFNNQSSSKKTTRFCHWIYGADQRTQSRNAFSSPETQTEVDKDLANNNISPQVRMQQKCVQLILLDGIALLTRQLGLGVGSWTSNLTNVCSIPGEFD